jgi:hypothetical protein
MVLCMLYVCLIGLEKENKLIKMNFYVFSYVCLRMRTQAIKISKSQSTEPYLHSFIHLHDVVFSLAPLFLIVIPTVIPNTESAVRWA